MKPQFWIAPILPGDKGPREWASDIDEACGRACNFSRATGCDYEVFERVAYVTPHTLKFTTPEAAIGAEKKDASE